MRRVSARSSVAAISYRPGNCRLARTYTRVPHTEIASVAGRELVVPMRPPMLPVKRRVLLMLPRRCTVRDREPCNTRRCEIEPVRWGFAGIAVPPVKA